MNTIQTLKEILDKIDYPVLIEVVDDVIWFRNGDELQWNGEQNISDLYHGEGDTYAGEIREGFIIINNYLVCNLDTHQGWWCTYFFNLDNEFNYDELIELMEDE